MTRRAATLVRPAVVLGVHLPSLDLVIGRDLRSASVGLAAAGDGISVVLLTVTNRTVDSTILTSFLVPETAS